MYTLAAASTASRTEARHARMSPGMRITWALIVVQAAIVLVGAPLAGYSIAWDEFWTLPALAAAVGAVTLLLRARGGWNRIADVGEVAAALGLLAVCVPMLTFILARTGLPLADQRLIAWDAALGFDWLKVVSLLKEREAESLLLCRAYASILQQPTALLLVLALAGYTRHLQQFALAWAIALAITVLIFPFLPGVGGYLHYGLTPAEFPYIRVPSPFLYGKVLMAARDGSMTELGRVALEGIVCFPSFHVAAAVLLAWGFWAVRLVRWPALALNVVMIVSSIFVGAHYLVDVIAGLAVAWCAIRLAKRWDVAPTSAADRNAVLVWTPARLSALPMLQSAVTWVARTVRGAIAGPDARRSP